MGEESPLYNVLFLCTGNSARSILAEAILHREGAGRFRAFSAGSQPTGAVNPFALALLKERNHDISGFRSKSWDEFAGQETPGMDIILTVCGSAANEVCPVWPGHPVTAHWGLPDPAAVVGADADIAAAFEETYQRMANRIAQLLALPMAALKAPDLKDHLQKIGQSG